MVVLRPFSSSLLPLCLLLAIAPSFLFHGLVSGEGLHGLSEITRGSSAEFDFEDPGKSFEFTIDVAGTSEECFYQFSKEGYELYVRMEVFRGGDKKVDLIIKNDRGEQINAFYWKSSLKSTHKVKETGTFSICVQNFSSRFANKVVFLHVISLNTKVALRLVKEMLHIEDAFMNVTDNVVQSLVHVEKAIDETKIMQQDSLITTERDWYQMTESNQYVQYWSIAQCVVIVLTAAMQVFATRRLFD